jgi:hypothetical protein
VQKLERDQDGGWKLIEPKARGLGGDMGLASALAEELRELTAVRWVSERPLEAHQLSAPWCKIDLQVEQKGEKKNLRLKLGAETQGGYFARSGDGPVFVTAASLGADARRWLFDRSALLVDMQAISRVVIAGRDREVRIGAQGDRWTVEGAPASNVGTRVKTALEQLIAEEVKHTGAADTREGIDKPALTVKITLRAGEERVVRIGATENQGGIPTRFARRDDIDATFLVAESKLRPFFDAL